MNGLELIRQEREAQITREGFSPHNDVEHNADRQLAQGALCYLNHYVQRAWTIDNELELNVSFDTYRREPIPYEWPDSWDASFWKPKGKIEDLVRVGALIAAEIDRLILTARKESR